MSRSRIAIAGCALLTLFSLASCFAMDLAKDPPEKRQFSLEAAPSNEQEPNGEDNKEPLVVDVEPVRVAVSFDRRPFVYRIANNEYETDYYSEFLILPSQRLTEILIEGVAALDDIVPTHLSDGRKGETSVVWDGVQIYGDYRDPQTPKAILSLRVAVHGSHRRLRFAVDVADTSPEALVAGYNQALRKALSATAAALRKR